MAETLDGDGTTAAPSPWPRIRRFAALVAGLAGALAVLVAIVVARWRRIEELQFENHDRAEAFSCELEGLRDDRAFAAWTGAADARLERTARAAESLLDSGSFRDYDAGRLRLERDVAEAWIALGEPRRAARRPEAAVERRIEEQRTFGSDLGTALQNARVVPFGESIADLRALRARALLDCGDAGAALREATAALELLESLEADDEGEILVFLPGLNPSREAQLLVGEILLAGGDTQGGEALVRDSLGDDEGRSSFPHRRARALLATSAAACADWSSAVSERRAVRAATSKPSNMDDWEFAQLSYELACTLDAGPKSGWDEALQLYERTLVARRATACCDFEAFAEHLTRLGRSLAKTGDSRRARAMLEEALAMTRRMFGRDDSRTLAAEQLVERTLPTPSLLEAEEARQREAVDAGVMQGGDTPDRVTALNELGRSLRAQGRAKEALATYIRALEMQQRIVPGDSPGAATLMNNVALARGRTGDRKGEKELLDESFAMRVRLFGGENGGDHEDIVQSLMNLASWHHGRDEFEKTWELESRAVAMMRRLANGDDMQLAIAIDNLGSTAADLDRDDESIALHREALAMERRLVTGDDPDVAQTLDELGVMLYRTRRYQEALATLGEAVHMRRRLFPEGHEETVTTLAHIGWTQEKLHELAGAVETYREAIVVQEKLDPDGSVAVLELRNNAARVLLEIPEPGQARAEYAVALELGTRLMPDSATSVSNSLKGIEDACRATQAWAESEAAVLAAGRAVQACSDCSNKARTRSRTAVAAFFRAWDAVQPSAERRAQAEEWAAKR